MSVHNISGPHIRPNLPDSQQPRIDADRPLPGARPLPSIADGAVVNGTVLAAREDGSYLVSVEGRTLLAQANIPLLAGQRFKAVWDASGDIPVLRLSEEESALLGKLSSGDRDVAGALLSRGLSLDSRALAMIRAAWAGMGQNPAQLAPLAELWARGLPMTGENVQVLSWYLSLDEKKTAELWKRTRESLRARLSRGEDPRKAIRALLAGGDETADFLRGHSLLSAPARGGVDPSLLAGAFLPVGEESAPLRARVSAGVSSRGGKSLWSVSFDMEGDRLGLVSGSVETDGTSLSVILRAERENGFEELRRRARHLRRELEGLPLALQNVAVARGRRLPRTPGRGLDVTA